MRLHRIRAINYRTLRDTTITFASNYCAISGHNNAGKSCVVKLIQFLLVNKDSAPPWRSSDNDIEYDIDKTQWVVEKEPIVIEYHISLSRSDDSAMLSLVERLLQNLLPDENLNIDIKVEIASNNEKTVTIQVGGVVVDDVARREIMKALGSSNNLLSHNSTTGNELEYYVSRGRLTVMYDFYLSDRDRKSLTRAEAMLRRETNKLARDHKNLLTSMLGRLNDKYDVEFAMPETSSSTRTTPLAITLSDKSAKVSLENWGSGTQNRTYIMLSILQASRIRAKETTNNRTTPIVLIEEPESFLHPSAQAEFGTVLQALSEETGIQIIVSTHSPFMLNQRSPKSNILLKRLVSRGKILETVVEDTSDGEWMKPFADHLGIIPNEFQEWRNIIISSNKRLLLVEGDIDKEYFIFLRDKFPDRFQLPKDVEVLSYGGRGALKNTTIISFVKQIVPKVFITFDLDAKTDVQRHLEQIGLQERKDFATIGKNKPGKQDIEGLLPDKVLQSVYAREVDLVAAAIGESSDARKSAKNALKRKLLDAFTASEDYSVSELREFENLGKVIAKALE